MVDVTASPLPQLVIGRIGRIDGNLESPYYQRKCAIYRIDLEERDSDDVWNGIFTETRIANFALADPDSINNDMHIMSSSAKLLPRVGDDHLQQYDPLTHSGNSVSMRDFLARAGVTSTDLQNYRVREVTYEFNAQIAVLGIVDNRQISPVRGSMICVFLYPDQYI